MEDFKYKLQNHQPDLIIWFHFIKISVKAFILVEFNKDAIHVYKQNVETSKFCSVNLEFQAIKSDSLYLKTIKNS